MCDGVRFSHLYFRAFICSVFLSVRLTRYETLDLIYKRYIFAALETNLLSPVRELFSGINNNVVF